MSAGSHQILQAKGPTEILTLIQIQRYIVIAKGIAPFKNAYYIERTLMHYEVVSSLFIAMLRQ